MTWRDDIDGIAIEVDRIVASAQHTGWQAPTVESELGSIRDYMAQVRGLLPLAPVTPPDPTPEPPPASLHGVAISYPGHSPARDLYLGYTDEQAQWGRHDGLPITAPVSGVVSLYTFTVGGAMVGLSPEAAALFAGWVCMAPPSTRPAGLQPMYVAVLVYDTPLRTPYGTVRTDWAAHVRGTVKIGRVAKDEPYAESYDSGIRFEANGVRDARAAHIHGCASATGTLSPNGDLDGLAFAFVRGWQPIQYLGEGGPGPVQYQQGGWTAGRRTTDFTQGGHPIPPIPS